MGIAAIATFALGSGQAVGATIHWVEDVQRGPIIGLTSGDGESVDLTIRGTSGTSMHPDEIVVENAAGTLSTTGTFPEPGGCEPEEVDCTSVPCHIEAPNRARCSVYDGFVRRQKVSPYESPYRSFSSGIWLFLSDTADRVTAPADNPVRFHLRSDEIGGGKTWDLSRVEAAVMAGEGDTLTSGVGANLYAQLGGPATVSAVNGRVDEIRCWEPTAAHALRLDSNDTAEDCAGDIQTTPAPVTPEVDPDQALTDVSDQAARVRRCAERNLAAPGSCTFP